MAKVLEQSAATPQHPTEALLNSLPVQPATSISAQSFKEVFPASDDIQMPASDRVMNVLLYVVLISAVIATVKIFWTSAMSLLK